MWRNKYLSRIWRLPVQSSHQVERISIRTQVNLIRSRCIDFTLELTFSVACNFLVFEFLQACPQFLENFWGATRVILLFRSPGSPGGVVKEESGDCYFRNWNFRFYLAIGVKIRETRRRWIWALDEPSMFKPLVRNNISSWKLIRTCFVVTGFSVIPYSRFPGLDIALSGFLLFFHVLFFSATWVPINLLTNDPWKYFIPSFKCVRLS